MHREITRSLYDMFPDQDKNDFYHAYIFLKHADHFVYHLFQASGLPCKKPEGTLDKGIEEMIQAAVRQISEKAQDHDTSTYHLKVLKLKDAIQLITQKEDIHIQTPEKVMPYKQAKDIILNNPDSIALSENALAVVYPKPHAFLRPWRCAFLLVTRLRHFSEIRIRNFGQVHRRKQ